MKKIKIGLMVIASSAVVGGILAYNVKVANLYCTATPFSGQCPGSCPNGLSGSITTNVPTPDFWCYTVTDDVTKCFNLPNCKWDPTYFTFK